MHMIVLLSTSMQSIHFWEGIRGITYWRYIYMPGTVLGTVIPTSTIKGESYVPTLLGFCCFSCCCDKMLWQWRLKWGRVYSESRFKVESMMTGNVKHLVPSTVRRKRKMNANSLLWFVQISIGHPYLVHLPTLSVDKMTPNRHTQKKPTSQLTWSWAQPSLCPSLSAFHF